MIFNNRLVRVDRLVCRPLSLMVTTRSTHFQSLGVATLDMIICRPLLYWTCTNICIWWNKAQSIQPIYQFIVLESTRWTYHLFGSAKQHLQPPTIQPWWTEHEPSIKMKYFSQYNDKSWVNHYRFWIWIPLHEQDD